MLEPKRLLDSLNHFGVHFLVGESHPRFTEPLPPAALLAGLTVQSDARMRLALIAVLLQRPEFAAEAEKVLDLLSVEQCTIFHLYYTASHYLQSSYYDQLIELLGVFEELPDLFSNQLDIPTNIPATDPLKKLAQRHQEITGLSLNWYGTYQHAARRVIARLKKEREWAIV